MSNIDRFYSKVNLAPHGCMEWMGGLFDDGYPLFWAQGSTHRGRRWWKIKARAVDPEKRRHAARVRWAKEKINAE